MKLKMHIASVVSVLLVALPVLPAEPSAAVGKLSARGTAEVNGISLPSEGTVFSGDRLSTEKGSTAALSLGPGNQVFFPELTLARVARSGNEMKVSLERGALAVVSRSGSVPVVEAGGVRVQSAGKSPAIFEVALHATALKVIARTGDARVISANHTLEVPEGRMLDATLGPAPQAPPAGTGMAPTGLTVFQITLIGIGVAAGITGLVLGSIALSRPNAQDCKITGSSPATITCP